MRTLANGTGAITVVDIMKLFLVLPAVAFLVGCAHHHHDPFVTNENATSENPKRNDSPYTTPLSTPGARFGLLPQVVQNTVRSEAGSAEIIDVRRQISEDTLYYKISFRDYVNFPPLLVGVDGSVLNSDLTVAVPAPQEASLEVKFTDLPPVVKKVIQEKHLASQISSVNLENWGNHTVYVFTYKDEAQPQPQKMYIVADGTLLVPARQN